MTDNNHDDTRVELDVKLRLEPEVWLALQGLAESQGLALPELMASLLSLILHPHNQGLQQGPPAPGPEEEAHTDAEPLLDEEKVKKMLEQAHELEEGLRRHGIATKLV